MDRKYYLEQLIKGANALTSDLFVKELQNNTYHYELANNAIQNKSKNWYNKRINDYTHKDLNKWEHLTKKYLEESKKTKSTEGLNPIFDKVWRSRFGNIEPIESGYPKNMNQIYVSDYIMFNPNCKLTFDKVDRILPYIKFKKIDLNTIQIDRWIFKDNGFFIDGSDRPNYEITMSGKELEPDEFVKTEEDKWLVVRAMLQIMNDTPDEFVNFNSYQIIGHWYNKNDSWLVSWVPNNYSNESKSDSNYNKLTKSELVINLSNKLEKTELINMLYGNAINCGYDLQNTGIKFVNNTFISITQKVMKELYKTAINKEGHLIENISDAKINTVINLNTLDLTEYLKINGEEKTRQLIRNINNRIQYRFNCANITNPDGTQITKLDLLARMYNLSLPFGLGLIEQAEKIKSDEKISIMTITDANKLLNEKISYNGIKSSYLDYVYGVPIKMDFSSFPIVDYRQFEKYNGTGSFNRCIESLKTEFNVDKIVPTKEYIRKEIKRINE
jgi:hypothetical protein